MTEKTVKTIVTTFSLLLVLLTLIVSGYALISSDRGNTPTVTSIHGETIELYNRGLYKLDSKSLALQGIAQDWVNIVLGIPLLIAGLIAYLRNSLRGRLILTGTYGYFVYTYMSYCFLWQYNMFFLLYVVLMALSIYGFIILMVTTDLKMLKAQFKEKTPTTFFGIFQLVLSCLFILMWLGRIATSFKGDMSGVQLEHYSTLVIQGLDLGIVVPATILSAIFIMKKQPLGYLLTSVILIKFGTLFTVLTGMVAILAGNNISQSSVESLIFLSLTLFVYLVLFIFVKNMRKSA